MRDVDVRVRIRFLAARESIARVRSIVESVIVSETTGAFTREDVEEILLAVQESLSNVLRHAYRGQTRALVELEVWTRGGRFFARLRDWGESFDPRAIEEPDPQQPREHGYGLFLVQQTMDRVDWRPQQGANVLVMERSGRRARQHGSARE